MQKNQNRQSAEGPYRHHVNDSQTAADLALELRAQLRYFYEALLAGKTRVRVPSPCAQWSAGEGHFHLASEVFLQIGGWTQFRLPHEDVLLQSGEILLMPRQLLHAETVGPDTQGVAFSNLVIYAEDTVLTCHIAQESTAEQEQGRPRARYMEACEHAQGQSIQYWLNDAVRISESCTREKNSAQKNAENDTQAEVQIRALVLAAVAGVMRSLDARRDAQGAEPQQVAMARLLIQNQMGNHQLSVRALAQQLGCTPDYLSRLFRQTTGEALATYINRVRMTRAARLLRETALSAKEVAWACGFVTQSYFIRVFREQFNMTPKAWRGREP